MVTQIIDQRQSFSRTAETPIIDIHRHCMAAPSNVGEKLIETFVRTMIGWRKGESATTITDKGVSSIVYPELMDIDAQVQAQEDAGISISVLSFSMQYELMCRKLSFLSDTFVAKKLNDRTAALVSKSPSKLAFMANVNPAKKGSVAECERCFTQLGAKGVNISTSWQGEFLDSDKLDHFWEYAESEKVPVFLHPPLLPIGYRKMDKYRLEEAVGRPFDTAMTVASMIYSGVFDRYPRLQVVLPHMGGGVPNVIGRLDFGYRLGYEGLPKGEAAVCRREPSEYLKTNLYVDLMGFSPAGMRHCLELFGADRLLFGSDYPAVNISPREHVELIENLGLDREDLQNVLWKTANRLFKLGLDEQNRPQHEDRRGERPPEANSPIRLYG